MINVNLKSLPENYELKKIINSLTRNPAITLIAGYEGIICGASGVYIGLAEVLNDLYDRKIFTGLITGQKV